VAAKPPPTNTLKNVTACHSDPPTGGEESNFKYSINFNINEHYCLFFYWSFKHLTEKAFVVLL